MRMCPPSITVKGTNSTFAPPGCHKAATVRVVSAATGSVVSIVSGWAGCALATI